MPKLPEILNKSKELRAIADELGLTLCIYVSNHPRKITIEKLPETDDEIRDSLFPRCCVCETKENLRKDGWYGHLCDSLHCMCC